MERADWSPGHVVASAYRAANRGRFAEANRHLLAKLRDSMRSSASSIRTSNKSVVDALPRISNASQRAQLQELVQTMRQFEDPHYCWKGSTQGGSITSIDLVRETIRQGRAIVTVALRLSNGTVRTERARLARTGAGWFISAIEVLQNNQMQRTGRGFGRSSLGKAG